MDTFPERRLHRSTVKTFQRAYTGIGIIRFGTAVSDAVSAVKVQDDLSLASSASFQTAPHVDVAAGPVSLLRAVTSRHAQPSAWVSSRGCEPISGNQPARARRSDRPGITICGKPRADQAGTNRKL